jgi:heme-degrading monooxygenase HmoA
MYARVNSTEWNSDKVDQGMQLTEDTIIPAYRECKGFKGYILLTEPSGDKAMAITLWETEEDMEASVAVARAMVGELKGILRAPPQAKNYLVRFNVEG